MKDLLRHGNVNGASIDEYVDGNAIAAVEIYPSVINAPPAFQPLGELASRCGVVVIWTGGR